MVEMGHIYNGPSSMKVRYGHTFFVVSSCTKLLHENCLFILIVEIWIHNVDIPLNSASKYLTYRSAALFD